MCIENVLRIGVCWKGFSWTMFPCFKSFFSSAAILYHAIFIQSPCNGFATVVREICVLIIVFEMPCCRAENLKPLHHTRWLRFCLNFTFNCFNIPTRTLLYTWNMNFELRIKTREMVGEILIFLNNFFGKSRTCTSLTRHSMYISLI